MLIIDQDNVSKDGILNVNVNPQDLIQSVVIDSRAPKELVDVYTSYLKNELYFKGNVRRSTLYDTPKPIKVKFKRKVKNR